MPIIKRLYYKGVFSLVETNKIIQFAADRKALTKGLKNIIDLSKLPNLYLKNGEIANENQIKFLFYRMASIKLMVSDSAAKLLLNYVETFSFIRLFR